MQLPKIIMIEWVDVQSVDMGLFSKSDLDNIEPAHAYIVGFVVKETNECYYVAKEYWDSNQYKYLHIIPKSTIVKVTELTENK